MTQREKYLFLIFGLCLGFILPILAILDLYHSTNAIEPLGWFNALAVTILIIMLCTGAILLASPRTRGRFIKFVRDLYAEMSEPHGDSIARHF